MHDVLMTAQRHARQDLTENCGNAVRGLPKASPPGCYCPAQNLADAVLRIM
jgi:hypothetical protein